MCILLIYTLIPSGSLSSLYSVCTCCSGGDTIRQIQMQSGAHVELHHGAQPNPNETLFNIRGTPQQVQVAQQLIRQKYENVPGAGGAGGPPFGPPGLELPNPSGPGVQTIQFPVPDNKCGLIIGKGEYCMACTRGSHRLNIVLYVCMRSTHSQSCRL